MKKFSLLKVESPKYTYVSEIKGKQALKSSENNSIIFPDYVAHDISKDFLKNGRFEIMTAGFLLRCQNLTLQITPKMIDFHAWKKND